VLALAVAEGVLRLARPRYADRLRGRSPAAWILPGLRRAACAWSPGPDDPQPHRVIWNRLGLRQHREFAPRKPDNVIRIGVFGDSYTENPDKAGPCSYTEPLDYALNRLGCQAEVLNFGVGGAGTDDALVRYAAQGEGLGLDVVVYQFYQNDVDDVVKHPSPELDDHGRYRPLSAPPAGAPTLFLDELLREAWIDVQKQLVVARHRGAAPGMLGEPRKPTVAEAIYGLLAWLSGPKVDRAQALARFRLLVMELDRRLRARGARFLVMIVPPQASEDEEDADVRATLADLGIETLYLAPLFAAEEPSFRQRYYFTNDSHWNERGSCAAARRLACWLAPQLGFPGGDAAIDQALREYEAAFGCGCAPDTAAISPAQREAIVAKYTELDRRAAAGEIYCRGKAR
jgi:hypothetical protein